MELSKNAGEKSLSDIARALIISFIILPILMAAGVGLYGFAVWFLQMYVIGLPTT